MNMRFSDTMRSKGYKYHIDLRKQDELPKLAVAGEPSKIETHSKYLGPESMTKEEALDWVREILVCNRGQELIGKINASLCT